MNTKNRIWLHRLFAAFIGGGAGAVTSGLTSMGFAPDKFNLTNTSGILHLLAIMAANFLINGILSAMFYLRQSPLPPEDAAVTETTGNSKPNEPQP